MLAGLAAMALLAAAWYLLVGTKPTAPAGQAGIEGAEGPRVVAVVGARPRRTEFAHEVEALGTVRANESVDITAKVAERIAAIHFREGQQVKQGQVLIELDSSEPRADLAAAEAAARDSRSQYQRSQELFQTRALSQAQLEQLEATLQANEARVAAARSRLNERVIRAPFAGRVGLRNVSPGGLVSPGTVITTLDDLSVVKLDFAVPELFLAVLQPGLSVQARSTAYAQAEFIGTVASIDTRVDPATRAVAIRALIDNREGRLRPGMFMTVTLVSGAVPAVMLQEQAVVPEGDRHFVFVVEQGHARRRQVTLGRRRPGEVEVLSGLGTEDTVVVEGTLNVRDGTPVRLMDGALPASGEAET